METWLLKPSTSAERISFLIQGRFVTIFNALHGSRVCVLVRIDKTQIKWRNACKNIALEGIWQWSKGVPLSIQTCKSFT